MALQSDAVTQLALFPVPSAPAARPRVRSRRPRPRRLPPPQTSLIELGRWRARSQADKHTTGNYFDLAQIADEINRTYFAGKLRVRIRWGRRAQPARHRRRRTVSIQLGSYDHRTGMIRVHPRLDAPDVPEYVVRNVVYHEMLHQFLGPERIGARMAFHTPTFRRLEQRCADYERAKHWEDDVLIPSLR